MIARAGTFSFAERVYIRMIFFRMLIDYRLYYRARSYLVPRGLLWDTYGIIFRSHDMSPCAAAASIGTGRNEFLFDNDFSANHTWLCFIGTSLPPRRESTVDCAISSDYYAGVQ